MIQPLDVLFDTRPGREVALPAMLAALYGPLAFPSPQGRPWVISNFVATLDGVASLGDPALHGGGEISGYNAHDRMVMGLLRAVADAIVVGAGTLRADSNHQWTARKVFPALAADFAELRQRLGLEPEPLNVFVSGRGDIDFGFRVFAAGELPVIIVTTDAGANRLNLQSVPKMVRICSVGKQEHVSAADVLGTIERVHPSRIILVEGGPQLMADFLAEGKLDELFLTVAPQVAGRDRSAERPGFVAGRLFAPTHPIWGRLVSVRRADNHLLLRYAFTDNQSA